MHTKPIEKACPTAGGPGERPAHILEQQLDPSANSKAAFTVKDPSDRRAFTAHWNKIFGDDGITIMTILFDADVAGSTQSHGWFGELEVSYWLGKEY